jgi:hypothetical protein
VEELVHSVNNLTLIVTEMKELLNLSCNKHKDEIQKISDEKQKLDEENKALKKNIGELNVKVTSLTWKSFRNLNQRSHVLVGNDIIHNVSEEMLEDTQVVCSKDGCISDVKKTVEQLNSGYDTITLVVGSNDCVKDTPETPEEIVKSYSELIDNAKGKCQNMTVSSMPPRLNPPEIQEKVDSVNAGLLAVCNERESVSFIDTTSIFKLADGSLNDGYLLAKGANITRPAMNKLASKLNLRIKEKDKGVCPVGSSNRQNKTKTTQENVSSRSSHPQQLSRQHGQPSRMSSLPKMRMSSQDSWCFNCGEGNHVRDRCRYTEPLVCHLCQHRGHKSKFCDLYQN